MSALPEEMEEDDERSKFVCKSVKQNQQGNAFCCLCFPSEE